LDFTVIGGNDLVILPADNDGMWTEADRVHQSDRIKLVLRYPNETKNIVVEVPHVPGAWGRLMKRQGPYLYKIILDTDFSVSSVTAENSVIDHSDAETAPSTQWAGQKADDVPPTGQ
jgi:hypothetical protein